MLGASWWLSLLRLLIIISSVPNDGGFWFKCIVSYHGLQVSLLVSIELLLGDISILVNFIHWLLKEHLKANIISRVFLVWDLLLSVCNHRHLLYSFIFILNEAGVKSISRWTVICQYRACAFVASLLFLFLHLLRWLAPICSSHLTCPDFSCTLSSFFQLLLRLISHQWIDTACSTHLSQPVELILNLSVFIDHYWVYIKQMAAFLRPFNSQTEFFVLLPQKLFPSNLKAIRLRNFLIIIQLLKLEEYFSILI